VTFVTTNSCPLHLHSLYSRIYIQQTSLMHCQWNTDTRQTDAFPDPIRNGLVQQLDYADCKALSVGPAEAQNCTVTKAAAVQRETVSWWRTADHRRQLKVENAKNSNNNDEVQTGFNLTPGSPGFNPDWKNRDSGCKFPPEMQPESLLLNLNRPNLPQNPTTAPEI